MSRAEEQTQPESRILKEKEGSGLGGCRRSASSFVLPQPDEGVEKWGVHEALRVGRNRKQL